MRARTVASLVIAILSLVACGPRDDAASAGSDSAHAAHDSATPGQEGAVVSAGRDTVAYPLPSPAEPDESTAIRSAGGRARRDGLTLEITLADGRRTAVQDDTVQSDEYARYEYAGHATPLPFHVVRVGHIEGRSFLLVHDSTGRRVAIDAPPVVSPDRTRFATSSIDLVAAYDPTRLAIWRVTGDTAVREWSVEPEGWGPSDARWVGIDTLAFVKNHATDNPDRVRRERARVVRTGGAWSVREP
jgi:hypothetical protein